MTDYTPTTEEVRKVIWDSKAAIPLSYNVEAKFGDWITTGKFTNKADAMAEAKSLTLEGIADHVRIVKISGIKE